MDIKNYDEFKNEFYKEVMAEISPYLDKINAVIRILKEKEKIYYKLAGYYFDTIAIDNAIAKFEQDLQTEKSGGKINSSENDNKTSV